MKTVLNPSAFKGSLKKKKYFEGWYLKHVSADMLHIYSFIPGISLSPGDRHCFIQVINGITGQTWYFRYPVELFQADKKKFDVKVGDSTFSQEGCNISLDCPELKVSGSIRYSYPSLYSRSLTHPGIMGWFSFVPGMECRHDVLSMSHFMSGDLFINGERISFDGGKGYIEKDWGWNFPKQYSWIHCNHFDDSDTSFLIAVATIPLGPFKFTGFLGYFSWNGIRRVFGTWNRWKLKEIAYRDALNGRIELKGPGESIICRVEGNPGGDLKAPEKGAMRKVIKESINSVIYLEYRGKESSVHEFRGAPAAFERRV